MVKIISMTFAVIVGIVIIAAGALYLYFGPEPVSVSEDETLADVDIQPAQALEIAEPYLEEYGTYQWKPDGELKRHMLRQGDWYYISRTDYPAKSLRYYLQPAVKVHTQTGAVEFSTRASK